MRALLHFSWRRKPLLHVCASKRFIERCEVMRNDKLSVQSMDFAVEILALVKELKAQRETIVANQIGRSGTSIGANLHEARYAHSTKDFISKLEIAQKECYETEYWLELLFETGYIPEERYQPLQNSCGAIRRMLISSLNTAKAKV